MPNLPEPVWGDSQEVFCEPSAMVKMGPSPTRITGFLVRALQAHFYTRDNIVDEVLRDAIWTDDTTSDTISSRILISAARHYDVRTIQQRPALLVIPDKLAASRVGMRDKALDGLNGHGAMIGSDHFRLLNGGHLVRAIARGEMAASRLAEEAFFRLMMYSPVMSDDMYVGDLQITGMSAPNPIEQDDSSCYAVDIGISWSLVFRWNLEKITPVLEKMVGRA